jgi:hypothetical protein
VTCAAAVACAPVCAGALLDDDGVALSFGNDEVALETLATGLVVFDRSHWVRCVRWARACMRWR